MKLALLATLLATALSLRLKSAFRQEDREVEKAITTGNTATNTEEVPIKEDNGFPRSNITVTAVSTKGWLRVGSSAFQDKSRYPNVFSIPGNLDSAFDPVTFAESHKANLTNSIGNSKYKVKPEVPTVDSFWVRL